MVARKEINEDLNAALAFTSDFINNEAREILDNARVVLKKRLSFFVYQGFFEPLNARGLKDDCLVIEAPTSFHRNWVNDHYMPELISAVHESLGRNIKVAIVDSLDPSKKELPQKKKAESKKVIKIEEKKEIALNKPETGIVSLNATNLNLSYNFDSFIAGPSNQICYEASLNAALEPGLQYSPLFIFGGVGLGKTHLLNAIGIKAKERNPHLKIAYISSEQWVNAYVQAAREKQFESFRNRYRYDCDILLIDDIQFLAGKDASQDEFFHTFNCLHSAKKQIVATSDKYPHEIEGLEERLQTRLSWGLIADIRPPDIETRLLILQKKAYAIKADLSDDILQLLASSVTSSVRELEGALMRLKACAALSKAPLTIGKAKEYLAPMLKKKTIIFSWQKICEVVAQNYGLRTSDVIGPSRQKQITFARQVAMMYCRSLLSMSLPEIGKAFGGRDHTTVLSSLRRIEECKRKDASIVPLLDKMENQLLALSQS